MTLEKSQKIILLLAGFGLIPIALGYGFNPEKTLTPLYGFPVDNINLRHIMRAVMGLYLAQVVFWFMGAINDKFRIPAMYCMVVFMLGLAGGRLLSLIVDGVSHWLLIVYLGLELAFGIVGMKLIKN